MAQQPSHPVDRRLLLGALGLLATVGVAWSNALSGTPIFDDHFLVVQQDCFRSLDGLLRILQFEPYYACGYRPLRFISYGVDHWLFGDFDGFKLGNVLRHIFAVAAAWLLAGRIFADEAAARDPDAGSAWRRGAWAGLAVAALWALHPTQTDSVSYVSGRRDVLVGLWTFVAVWGGTVASRRGGLWWLLPLWATLLAFLSKESAVVIPVLFLLWTIRGAEIGPWLRQNVGVVVSVGVGLALSFLLVLWRGFLASHSQRHLEWWGGDIGSNFATVAALQTHYFRHVFLAHPLIGDYSADTIPLATGFGDPRALVGVALVVALLAIAGWCRRRRPLVTYGVLWYLVALAPMSHILPHHELFAEHYLYVPLFGAMLAIVDAVRWGIERSPVPERWLRIAVAVLGVVLATMVVRVHARNMAYADELAFYEAVVQHAPQNQRAAGNLAYIHADAQRLPESLYWFERMRPLWTPGSGDERRALLRQIVVAREAGEISLARTVADVVVERHAEIGAGHRLAAELAGTMQDWPAAWAHATDYVRVTGGPGGAVIQARAASATGAIPLDAVREAGAAAARDGHLTPEVAYYFGAALAQRGEVGEAVDWWLAHRPTPAPSPYDAALCDAAARAGRVLEVCTP